MAQENHVFDLIFLDAAKGQYLNFFSYLEQILAPGGIIIADNVLLNGWVVNLDYPNHRRKNFCLSDAGIFNADERKSPL